MCRFWDWDVASFELRVKYPIGNKDCIYPTWNNCVFIKIQLQYLFHASTLSSHIQASSIIKTEKQTNMQCCGLPGFTVHSYVDKTKLDIAYLKVPKTCFWISFMLVKSCTVFMPSGMLLLHCIGAETYTLRTPPLFVLVSCNISWYICDVVSLILCTMLHPVV
jgi:hypothetical protein